MIQLINIMQDAYLKKKKKAVKTALSEVETF